MYSFILKLSSRMNNGTFKEFVGSYFYVSIIFVRTGTLDWKTSRFCVNTEHLSSLRCLIPFGFLRLFSSHVVLCLWPTLKLIINHRPRSSKVFTVKSNKIITHRKTFVVLLIRNVPGRVSFDQVCAHVFVHAFDNTVSALVEYGGKQ